MATFHGSEVFLGQKEHITVLGINTYSGDNAEVVFHEGHATEERACERVTLPSPGDTLAVIVSKSVNLKFGGESGANEKNVAVALTYVENESGDDVIVATDLVRLALERGGSAEQAVDTLGALIEEHVKSDSPRYGFVVCDNSAAWLLNSVGNVWAAEKLVDGCRSLARDGFTVGQKIDKQCDKLQDKTKELGLWDGSGDFDFCKIFTGKDVAEMKVWGEIDEEVLSKMFESLRQTENGESVQTSQVSILTSTGLCHHWFTATQHPAESVFKPFVFTPNARISPLTKAANVGEQTALTKLHANRNWAAVGDLLKSLESSCVDEVKTYLLDHSSAPATQELDDLMKDCVEAEVKFYRN